MRIPCPYCGERDFSEFACVGEASLQRPDPNGPDASQRWTEAVYLRTNPAGVLEEFWFHRSGCRSWLRLTRDTLTHEILAASFVEARPIGWADAARGAEVTERGRV